MTGTVDALRLGSALFGRDERIVTCCSRFAELAGRPLADLLGVWIADLVERENHVAGRWLLEQLWDTNSPFTFLSRYKRPDGALVTIESWVASMNTAAGRTGIILARSFTCQLHEGTPSGQIPGVGEYVADMTRQLAAFAGEAQMPVTCDLLGVAAHAARSEAAVSD